MQKGEEKVLRWVERRAGWNVSEKTLVRVIFGSCSSRGDPKPFERITTLSSFECVRPFNEGMRPEIVAEFVGWLFSLLEGWSTSLVVTSYRLGMCSRVGGMACLLPRPILLTMFEGKNFTAYRRKRCGFRRDRGTSNSPSAIGAYVGLNSRVRQIDGTPWRVKVGRLLPNMINDQWSEGDGKQLYGLIVIGFELWFPNNVARVSVLDDSGWLLLV